MVAAARPYHRLRRYRDMARLMFRLSRDDAVRPRERRVGVVDDEDPDLGRRADVLADELEELGPTFVKLGQVLSTHIELPPEYARALSRLREACQPEPFEQVRAT